MTVRIPVARVATRRQQSAGSRRPRLFLHLGLPKSGTTSLQQVLQHHRGVLAEHGYCYPDGGEMGHFLAALEMTAKEERWGFTRDQVAGHFAELLDQGRAHGGDLLISHEMFAQAQWAHVPEIVAAASDFELHVVLTVRDLGRVVAASWQESVKNGRRASFDQFVDRKATRLPGRAAEGEIFWRYQNVEEVLRRWGQCVPPERMHVVVCPPATEPRGGLWRRFAAAVDLPAELVDVNAVPLANESLGAGQVAFLRAVNVALDRRLEEPHGDRLRKHWLAQTLLSRAESDKAVAPQEVVERFGVASRRWVSYIEEVGCVVHGDLDDLFPRAAPGSEQAPHPDDVTASQQLAGVPEAVAEMLLRVRDLELDVQELDARNRSLESELAESRPWSWWARRSARALRRLPGRARARWRRSASSE